MPNSILTVPTPHNEPVLGYVKGSPERARLTKEIDRMAGERPEIPLIIGGERISTGNKQTQVMPHHHEHVVCDYHVGGAAEVERAIGAAAAAKSEWELMPWESRAAVVLRAAELAAGKYRMWLNASTMLGQGKTAHQAEIDAACELIDFLRFNAHFAEQLYRQQPASSPGMWNATELRPLEGFVLAITPFNFTAIAGNLAIAPALMGNTMVWKPSDSQMLSAYYLMLMFEEAGMPPGVINFVPGDGATVARAAMGHRDFSGLHFTGSTDVFRSLWKQCAANIDNYRTYPRLVGETGGKDFIVAHPSADPDAVVAAMVRGAYEYQGQKCSAASRAYIAKSLWNKIKDKLLSEIASIKMGDPADLSNFMGAVIKRDAFNRHRSAIDAAKASDSATVIAGGETDDSVGYFVRPTLILCDDPKYTTMETELFGPIMSAFVYDDADFDKILTLVDDTSPYALTGAVFANDRRAVDKARIALRGAAGNFYINDKPTGAVVGQQPFGGARASGTNDKAGAPQNLARWASARTVKETFAPPTDYRYPFLD